MDIINLNLAVTPADKVTDKTYELGTKSHLLKKAIIHSLEQHENMEHFGDSKAVPGHTRCLQAGHQREANSHISC